MEITVIPMAQKCENYLKWFMLEYYLIFSFVLFRFFFLCSIFMWELTERLEQATRKCGLNLEWTHKFYTTLMRFFGIGFRGMLCKYVFSYKRDSWAIQDTCPSDRFYDSSTRASKRLCLNISRAVIPLKPYWTVITTLGEEEKFPSHKT